MDAKAFQARFDAIRCGNDYGEMSELLTDLLAAYSELEATPLLTLKLADTVVLLSERYDMPSDAHYCFHCRARDPKNPATKHSEGCVVGKAQAYIVAARAAALKETVVL
jgi:Golgi nucleoside diphosphatase